MVNKNDFYYKLVMIILSVCLIAAIIKIKGLKKEMYFTALVKIPEKIVVEDFKSKEKVFKLTKEKQSFIIIFFRSTDCSSKIKKTIEQMKQNEQFIAIGIHSNKKEFWTWIENYEISKSQIEEKIFFLNLNNYCNNYYLYKTPIKIKLIKGKIYEIGEL